MDRKKEQIERFRYDFERGDVSTVGLARTGAAGSPLAQTSRQRNRFRPPPEEYMAKVETVREGMRRGDYYEVVLRQTFQAPLFRQRLGAVRARCRTPAPAPTSFCCNSATSNWLGASPEMFVRVEGQRVETCPIAGTARRTGDPLRDADNIRELLNSTKEESELTMCTDVDRNDKSRVCDAGHGEGDRAAADRILRRRVPYRGSRGRHAAAGFRFARRVSQHMWAVTHDRRAQEGRRAGHRRSGKGRARLVRRRGGHDLAERRHQHRHSDPHLHLRDGIARYSAGATLLYDSVPELEERETRLKATGFFRALRGAKQAEASEIVPAQRGGGVKLLLVDNDDCFIHTLANYARQTGRRSGDLSRRISARVDPGFRAASDL